MVFINCIISTQVFAKNRESLDSLKEVTLQLKWHHQFQFAGYYAAQSQGYYQEEGLQVNLLEGGERKSAIGNVTSGKAQFGVGDSELLIDYAQGKPIVVIGAIFQHSPYILLSRQDSKIRTPHDLVGKRLMLDAGQGAAQFKVMLKHEGIDVNKITIIPHTWDLQDLIDHKVDAVSGYITAEPNYLLSQGIKPAILNSINYGVDFYGDTLFTNKQELEAHPEQVAAFLRASQKGWAYALEHKEQLADQIINMPEVRERGITRDILLSEARDMEPLILPNVVEIGHLNPGRWQHIAAEFAGLGLMAKNVDLTDFVYRPAHFASQRTKKKIIYSSVLASVILICTASWLLVTRRKLRTNSEQLLSEVNLRHVVESDLLIAQARVNEMFRATSAGIAITSMDGRYVTVNPAYCKMLQYTEEELKHMDFASLTYEADRAENMICIQKLIDGEIPDFVKEKRYIRKDGSLIWVRATMTTMRVAHGQPTNLVAVTEDISEQMQIKETLKRSEDLLNIASKLSHLGGWELDLATMKMTWSDEVAVMHEMPPGTTPSLEEGVNLIAPEYRAEVKRLLQECISTGKPYDVEFQKITTTQRRIWVRSVGVAVRDAEGKIIRIQGAFQEITPYKNLEIFNRELSLILESIASRVPLNTVLEDCVKLIETQLPHLICAVNLISDNGAQLKTGTSRNLPADYVKAIDGQAIGETAGSCGTAAYLKKEIIVSDIANDPLWADFKHLALNENLRACWSWPVFSSKGVVIGTFAAYSRKVNSPKAEELALLRSMVKTLGIAIEKEKASAQIYLLESAISRLNDIVLITNATPIDGEGPVVVFVNDAFEAHTGYSREEIIGKTPRILQGKNTQRSELDRIHHSLKKWEAVRAELINYKKNGEEFWLDLDIVPLLNQNGLQTHWVAVERDITDRKESELEMLRLNRALRLLSACNDLLVKIDDETKLINEVCKLIVEIGGYRMAWVGYAHDDENKSVVPVGGYGDYDNFLSELNLSWSENNLRGLGPGGKTIRNANTIIVEDIAADTSYPAIESAMKRGYLSLVSLPLLNKNRCFGLLAMYASEVRHIPEEEIKLLEEMAEDLSFGIMNIRAKLEQQKIQAAVSRVATSVSNTSNNQFFEQLIQNMVAATDADAGFIAKIVSNDPLTARTLAAEVDGKPIDSIEYDVNNSPCSNLIHADSFVMSESASQCFNYSKTMIALGMKDYIGQRLVNNKGQVIGMLFVMRRKVHSQNDFAISTLKIFATRAAAEIERQDYDRHISNQASLLDKAQDAIVVRGIDHRIQFWNKGAERMYGWTQDEVLGESIVNLTYPDSAEFIEAEKTLLRTGEWSNEVVQKRKDGSEIFAEVHWTLVRDEADQPLSVLCINTDITQRKVAAGEIQHLAFYDQLTHLPNRSLMLDRLQHAIATSMRTGKYGALLFIDIDNFKTINDTMGHGAGDMLLKGIAQRLVQNTRDSDTVSRLGGDEFIVMLEELSEDAAEAAVQSKMFAEKLLQVFQEGFEIDKHIYHSTPSIGITIFHDDTQTASELLQQSDLAMYQAKASGRNTLRFYDPQMQIAVTKRAELEDDLRNGLKKEEFMLHYQPQFDTHNHCVGAEALLRWKHLTKGMISPAEFIPLAEETLLILPIGKWVLETACKTLLKWQQIPAMSHMTLAVNVSVNQFRQADFVAQVTDIIEETGINPALLKLELTESLFAENTQDIIAKMMAIKKLGVVFSLDDFGTGYSSLYYLKRLPLNQLKIDQSFVREILTDSNDATICRSIITLAKSLGLEVIAEGVEQIEQKEFLFKEGCYLYQGYFFSKPLPALDIEEFMLKRSLH